LEFSERLPSDPHGLLKVVVRQRGIGHVVTAFVEKRGLGPTRLSSQSVKVENFHGCGMRGARYVLRDVGFGMRRAAV
jgi:hypothetical protein